MIGHGRGQSTVEVTLTLAPDPKPFTLQFIVELIPSTADQKRRGAHPMMVGPFESYEQADAWILRLGRSMAPRFNIHQLVDPAHLPFPAPSETATIHQLEERK
jgi:hypothetical protein